MDTVVLDLSRAFAGSESQLAKAALEASSEPNLIVVGLEAQRAALGDAVEYVFIETDGYEPNVGAAVAEALRQHADKSTSSIVYSFHPSVSNGKAPNLADFADTATFNHATRLIAANTKESGEPTAWPNELIPLDEALSLLAEVLTENNAAHHPMYKSKIRVLLKQKSRRFDPRSGLPGANTPNLISRLLAQAEERGLIDYVGTDPSTVRVRLKRGATAPEEAAAVAPVTNAPEIDAGALPVKDEQKSRSERFQDILIDRTGLFSDVRERLLDNVQGILAVQATRAEAGEIVKQAVKKTKTDSPAYFARKSNDDLPKDKYPWRKVEGFALVLFARIGIIVDDEGKPIREGGPWQIRRGYFTEIPDNWKTLVDAELILELIRAHERVDFDDIEDLAGAMWCERTEDLIDRVDAAIDYLTRKSRASVSASSGELEINGDDQPTPPFVGRRHQ
ncbi:hypothetical protein [Mycobacterium intracellulare]|uniref:hypothetical protein n=1 Tax=Mycobacterium intracellulare TaxID=1767 RepID=UPI000AC65B74|nr:hypothetical protein [Mycobacterium intracellulare]